jgi:metal-responsive CopG/Arc/MetJ family transcriptional regulator
MSRKNKQVTITLPPEVLEEIDRERGLITRSRYIASLLEKIMKLEKGVEGGLGEKGGALHAKEG